MLDSGCLSFHQRATPQSQAFRAQGGPTQHVCFSCSYRASPDTFGCWFVAVPLWSSAEPTNGLEAPGSLKVGTVRCFKGV